MSKRELPMKTSDEHDALTRWRRFLNWRPGVRASIKRGYNKRVRREEKRHMRNSDDGAGLAF
jgi:hypothetical protein